MSESRVEIICLVEGEDSIMSTCVRGLHSYQAPPLKRAWDDFAQIDIAWDAAFAPCVTRLPNGSCQVDFDAAERCVGTRIHRLRCRGRELRDPAGAVAERLSCQRRSPTMSDFDAARHAARRATRRWSSATDLPSLS